MKLFSAKPRILRFAVVIALLCVAFFVAFEYSKPNRVTILVSTPQLQSVNVGSYNDNDWENVQRTAIDELSRQIRLHPKTSVYEIHYAENNPYLFDTRFIYARSRQALVYSYESKPVNEIPGSSRWVFTPRFPFIVKQTSYFLSPRKVEVDVPNISHVTDQDVHNAAKHKLSWQALFDAKKLRKP